MFLSSAFFLSLNRSFFIYIGFFLTIILLTSCYNKTIELVLYPLWKYKIFLVFSFVFSLIISSDLNNSLLLFLRFSMLILLSVWLNHSIDFKKLLAASERILYMLSPTFLQDKLKKTVFSTLLGIEYCATLLSDISLKKQKDISINKKDAPFIKKNVSLLLKLFFGALSKAVELESQFPDKTFNSDVNPQNDIKLCKSDYLVMAFSITIIFVTFYKL